MRSSDTFEAFYQASEDRADLIDQPIAGVWQAVLDSVEITFARSATAKRAVDAFKHRMVPDTTKTRNVHVVMLASRDESVLGRCATAQSHWRNVGVAYVTIVDSRMTPNRLVDLCDALHVASKRSTDDCCDLDDRCRDIVFCRTRFWGTEDPGRAPDLMRQLSGTMDPVVAGPVEHSVSLAGGRCVVGFVRPADIAPLLWVDQIASTRSFEECMDLNCKNAAMVRLTRRYRVRSDTFVILVCHEGYAYSPLESQRYEIGADGAQELVIDGVVLPGTPAHHVCAQITHLVQSVSEDPDWSDAAEPVHPDTLDREAQLVSERHEAIAAIRGVLCRDEVLKTIKALVWRPEGRLVETQMQAATASPRAPAQLLVSAGPHV